MGAGQSRESVNKVFRLNLCQTRHWLSSLFAHEMDWKQTDLQLPRGLLGEVDCLGNCKADLTKPRTQQQLPASSAAPAGRAGEGPAHPTRDITWKCYFDYTDRTTQMEKVRTGFPWVGRQANQATHSVEEIFSSCPGGCDHCYGPVT